MTESRPMNIGVLASGEGTTLQSILDACRDGRFLNTHPALLPRFGGQGMYGDRVFEAVLESGDEESGISVHLVDSEYDAGRVVAQCKVPVMRGDVLVSLRTRVREREREFVVDTIAAIARGEIRLDELANRPLQPTSGRREFRQLD